MLWLCLPNHLVTMVPIGAPVATAPLAVIDSLSILAGLVNTTITSVGFPADLTTFQSTSTSVSPAFTCWPSLTIIVNGGSGELYSIHADVHEHFHSGGSGDAHCMLGLGDRGNLAGHRGDHTTRRGNHGESVAKDLGGEGLVGHFRDRLDGTVHRGEHRVVSGFHLGGGGSGSGGCRHAFGEPPPMTGLPYRADRASATACTCVPTMIWTFFLSITLTPGTPVLRMASTSTFEESDDIAKDYVIRTEPGAHEMADQGSTVVLVISMGPEDTSVNVPKFVNLPLSVALERAAEYHLDPQVRYEDSEDVEKDVVMEQSIDPGSMVDRDTPIELVVSTGEISEKTRKFTYSLPKEGFRRI